MIREIRVGHSMKLRNAAVVVILVLLAGCGRSEEAAKPAESAVSPNKAFGNAFDIRDFNQQVLNIASTPLPFIEATVISWILSTPR